ncbi:unnamed protein product [Urochloa decumbens]|uniref:F-box domain-containing protein n=1 Tax=Urochloa decumbens TaxID=240449 RepID=A0ABC8YIP2_9POAL
MEQHEAAPAPAPAQRLPHDVLADVLRRLPPRGLAAARCVCTDWRAAVDDRRLLRAAIDALLPRSLDALLVNNPGFLHTEFFSRPGALADHCNGLLLLDEHVVNPATRRWAPLPRLDNARDTNYFFHEYLAYDPAVSLHYEVLRIPRISWSYTYGRPDDRVFVPGCDANIEDIEWPPSPFIVPVFSSMTGQWEKRSLVREGLAVGSNVISKQYIPSDKTSFGQRSHRPLASFGRISEKGVYYVLHEAADPLRLRVWILDESCGQMEWVLKYDHDLSPVLELWNRHEKLDGQWVLQDVNYYKDHSKLEEDPEEAADLKLEWDSDNDDFLEEGIEIDFDGDDDDICYIGFHPYKEVVFFSRSIECNGLAYHLSSSKVQNLGNLSPKSGYYTCYSVGTTFCYTPCWLEELPGSS